MIFYVKLSIKVFFKLLVSFLLVIGRHAQSTQNIRFVTFLQYLKKQKRGRKLIPCIQINIKISYNLILLIVACMADLPKLLKIPISQNLCNILRKK